MAKQQSITLTIEAAVCSSFCANNAQDSKVLRCGTLQTLRLTMMAICCVVALALTHYAFAEDPVPVETTLKAEVLEKFELNDGRQSQRLVPAGVITQGDVVFYTLQIRNPTSVPARDVAVIQRIPENTRYLPGSASGPSVDITFSIDGGLTFNPPKDLVVVTPTGMSRPATPADYTHIRWQLRNVLAPGALAHARFQAVFE